MFSVVVYVLGCSPFAPGCSFFLLICEFVNFSLVSRQKENIDDQAKHYTYKLPMRTCTYHVTSRVTVTSLTSPMCGNHTFTTGSEYTSGSKGAV